MQHESHVEVWQAMTNLMSGDELNLQMPTEHSASQHTDPKQHS